MWFSLALPLFVAVAVSAQTDDASLIISAVKSVHEQAATKKSGQSVVVNVKRLTQRGEKVSKSGMSEQQMLVETIAMMDTRGRKLSVAD